jgi:hypothetical protein
MTSKKTKDHYVAAALIGRFSSNPAPQLRRSPIHVLRRGRSDPYPHVAEGVAYKTSLYTLEELWVGETIRMVDDVWTRLEAQLPQMLTVLEETDGLVDARLWGEAMVPFIASLFVRTPDFGKHFKLRFAVLGRKGSALTQPDSITQARLLQLQRLFAPVMRARWRLLRGPDEAPLITSNLALAPFSIGSDDGWIVPLGRSMALHLSPRPRTPRVWLTAPSGQTFVDVEVHTMTAAQCDVVNRAMAAHAPEEIYGGDDALLRRYVPEMGADEAATTSMYWDQLLVLRRNQRELIGFLEAIASPYRGPRTPRAEALAQMDYPLPLFVSINPESHMSDEESEQLSRIEDAEAQNEHARLSKWLPVEALEEIRLRETE